MNGLSGVAGWRYIFYIEGIFTVLCGAIAFYFIPSTPGDSKYLTPLQKSHILRRLALDRPEGESAESEKFTWKECFNALTSIHVLILMPALYAAGLLIFGYGYFTPTIVAGFKFDTITTQLLTAPPFVFSFFVTMVVAYC